MSRHIRLDNDTTLTTLDEVFDHQGPPADPDADRADRNGTADRTATIDDVDAARKRFGGMNLGACFFGWLVAISSAVLLVSIVAAALVAVSTTVDVAQSDAERRAGTVGIAAGVVLLVVLLVGYYAGGYVGGRMSRFDGGRQGLGVWAIGLAITLVAAGVIAIVGARYDLLDRVDLSRIALSTEEISWGAAITGVSLVLGTLLAATVGGVIGRHYHDRVDRAVHG